MSELDWYPGEHVISWTETPEQSAERTSLAVAVLTHGAQDSVRTGDPIYASFRNIVRLEDGRLARSPAVYHGYVLDADILSSEHPTAVFARLNETLYGDSSLNLPDQTIGVEEFALVALANTVDFVCSVTECK